MIKIIYVGAICAANLSVSYFGPAAMPINSFALIGLDMVARDKLHDKMGFKKVMALTAIAGFASYLINPESGRIAVASLAAFGLSQAANAIAYQRLIKREWMQRSNASNAVGALVDSVLFPALAFGAFLPTASTAQFIAKVSGGAVWSWLLRKVKA